MGLYFTEAGEILISRRVPDGNKLSDEFYLLRGSSVGLPPIIVEPNEKTDGVKNILNSISSVPYFPLSGNEDNDLLLSKDKKSQEEFQRKKNMFLFLGHLQASLETFESISDGGEFQNEISALEAEYERLKRVVDDKAVQRRIESATATISQRILDYLRTLDVEEKYRKIPPEFSVKDLNVRVRSSDGHWHFLAEVGSASNWVSFHIALMCSLQEYFLEQAVSCVPSFVIFDQPSQVYFPKLKRNQELEENLSYHDEDVDAVRSIFRTLAKSVIASKGGWQSIVLDHADAGIYGDIEGVHEVEIWRDGIKLIPLEWYSK